MSNSPDIELLTVEEVAGALGIGRTRAYALVSGGQIPSVRIGASRRVRRSAVAAFIEGLEAEAKELAGVQ